MLPSVGVIPRIVGICSATAIVAVVYPRFDVGKPLVDIGRVVALGLDSTGDQPFYAERPHSVRAEQVIDEDVVDAFYDGLCAGVQAAV